MKKHILLLGLFLGLVSSGAQGQGMRADIRVDRMTVIVTANAQDMNDLRFNFEGATVESERATRGFPDEKIIYQLKGPNYGELVVDGRDGKLAGQMRIGLNQAAQVPTFMERDFETVLDGDDDVTIRVKVSPQTATGVEHKTVHMKIIVDRVPKN